MSILQKIDLKSLSDWWHVRDVLEPAGYIFMGMGRSRFTFMAPHRRFVLKFPRGPENFHHNIQEYNCWRRYHNNPDIDGICYAPCRLMKSGILMMRSVVSIYGDTSGCHVAREKVPGVVARSSGLKFPDWIKLIDCEQVGYLPNGRLVAYDYSE